MHFSAEKFRNYLNTQHKSIKFASQMTENDLLWFLDIQISYGNNQFVTSIYRKPTFSGIFPNIESLITDIYKRDQLKLYFAEVLDYVPTTRTFIKRWTLWSQYLNIIVITMISWITVSKSFWISYIQRDLNFIVPKRELICVSPYLDKTFDLRTRLRRTIERNFHIVNWK